MKLWIRLFFVCACALPTWGLSAHARPWDMSSDPHRSPRTVRSLAREPRAAARERVSVKEFPLSRTWRSEEFGVSIQYPEPWEQQDLLEETDPLTLVVMFLSEEDRNAIRQNVNLVVETLPSPMTLGDYSELGIDMEKDFFDNFALQSSQDVILAGTYRAHRVIFSASTDSGEMTFEQVWLVRDKKAYVWTFADDADFFDDHIGTFERMLDTFTLRS